MTPEALVLSMNGPRRPRDSKLPAQTWFRAASLFAESQGQVRLHELCSECRVSHRTAWRMRTILRDTAEFLKEEQGRQRRALAH